MSFKMRLNSRLNLNVQGVDGRSQLKAITNTAQREDMAPCSSVSLERAE